MMTDEAALADYYFIDAFRVIKGAAMPYRSKARAVAQYVAAEIIAERSRLRAATEDDVTRALELAYIDQPDIPAALMLEFFNRMLDVMGGEDLE